MNGTEPSNSTLCVIDDYLEYLNERFYTVAVLGSSVSVISIFENLFLFSFYVSSKRHRDSCSFYLMLLAMADVFVSGTYVLIMSIKVFYIYAESIHLQRLWMAYVVPMLVTSHIAMTASSFLIVFATVERYCITVSHGCINFLHKNRKVIALFAVFIGVFSKGSMLFEIKRVYIAHCSETMKEYELQPTELVLYNWHYNKLFRVWFRKLATVLFPFFLLTFLNLRIIAALRANTQKELHEQSFIETPTEAVKQRKAQVKAATRTLVFVVFTYLLSNMLNVIVTIWEQIDTDGLRTNFPFFYVISVDIVSLLTVISCALRLPIYASCQEQLRKEIKEFATGLLYSRKPPAKHILMENCDPDRNGVSL